MRIPFLVLALFERIVHPASYSASRCVSRLLAPTPVLPNKMERCFSAAVFQFSYRASSLELKALNLSSLLSAYQAELMEDMGRMLPSGNTTPALWKEIVTGKNLVL